MTTINTIEDLVRVLDENPAWVEALRSRLLSRELLELPEKFSQFVETTNKRFDALERRFDQRMDGLDQRMDGFDQRLDNFEQSTDRHFQRIEDTLSYLKGAHARNAAIEDSPDIARNMGRRQVRNLTRSDLWEIIDAADISDIPANVLASFRRADLIMEATDPDGETGYIAVEISFTVDDRDVVRAVRNAAFLTRFTGHPAHAAVAGINRDDRIEERLASGEVFWHQIYDEDLAAE